VRLVFGPVRVPGSNGSRHHVAQPAGVWVCGRVGVRVCVRVGVRVCVRAGVQVCVTAVAADTRWKRAFAGASATATASVTSTSAVTATAFVITTATAVATVVVTDPVTATVTAGYTESCGECERSSVRVVGCACVRAGKKYRTSTPFAL
jgi:hypothetical protein